MNKNFPKIWLGYKSGFTLVEILVSLAVLTILLLISAQVIGQVQTTWSASNARVSQFREARTAFDIITRNLSQATLNPYMDYANNYLLTASANAGSVDASSNTPGNYVRKSDLHFVCGEAADLVTGAAEGGANLPGHAIFFQAPLGVTEDPNYVGLDKLMCARGYFVQYSNDEAFRPSFLPQGDFKWRYRLMEYSPPAEKNSIYTLTPAAGGEIPNNWFADAGLAINAGGAEETAINISKTRPVADNIVALIISPRREAAPGETNQDGPVDIAPNFAYDSNNKIGATDTSPQGYQFLLPPLVRVVLIAIDEKSAERLSQASGGQQAPLGTELNALQDTAATELEATIAKIVNTLAERQINYRVFSATVQLRGSKWSI